MAIFIKKLYSSTCKSISGIRLKEASLVCHHFVDKISHNVKNNFFVYYVIKHFFCFVRLNVLQRFYSFQILGGNIIHNNYVKRS